MAGEIYSATLLQTFKLCPTKYFLKYRLGMPTPNMSYNLPMSGNRLDEYDDSILSTVKGELIHSILHDFLTGKQDSEEAIIRISEQVIGKQFANLFSSQEANKLLSQVVENVKNALATLRKIVPNFTLYSGQGTLTEKFYAEQIITRRFGDDFLTGTLDLLLENEKGFHIFDYKTNRLDKGTGEIYSEYEMQMKLYASLCSRLAEKGMDMMPIQQNDFDVTIIFTREPGKYLTKIYSRSELGDFERELEATLGKIKMIAPVSSFYPAPHDEKLPTSTPHCNDCEYFAGKIQKKCLMKRD